MNAGYDAHAADTRPNGRMWEVIQRGNTVTATVDGLPDWSLDHPDAEEARRTWQLLTALAEPVDEPVNDNADGW